MGKNVWHCLEKQKQNPQNQKEKQKARPNNQANKAKSMHQLSFSLLWQNVYRSQRKRGFVQGHSLRVRSRAAGAWDNWSHHIDSRETQLWVLTLSLFSSFDSYRNPRPCNDVVPIEGGSKTHSNNRICKVPHRHSQATDLSPRWV